MQLNGSRHKHCPGRGAAPRARTRVGLKLKLKASATAYLMVACHGDGDKYTTINI